MPVFPGSDGVAPSTPIPVATDPTHTPEQDGPARDPHPSADPITQVQQPHWHLHLFFGMSCNRLVAPRIFESLVSLCVRARATATGLRTSHLRTRNGDHEIDLIVENTAGRVVAIEVKLTRDPDDADVRHLHWLGNRIGERLVDKVVVTTGEYAYRRNDGVAVIPLGLLS